MTITPDHMTAVLVAAKDGRLKDKLYIDVWCDGSTACAVETAPHGHWRGGYSVAADQVILRLKEERDDARAKVRLITEQYKPGWVDGLNAVARSVGYDPDKLRHEGVDPPTFIEDVIFALRAENERLRALLDEAEDIVRDYSPGHTVWLEAVAAERKP